MGLPYYYAVVACLGCLGSQRPWNKASDGNPKNAAPILGSGYIDDHGLPMLRNLPIERFGIKWHYESRLVTPWSLSCRS